MWNVYEIQQDPLNDVRITNEEQRKVEQDNEKAIYKTKLSTFSRTGNNIIVFVLDMFTGDHVERLFADYPELKDSFEGFVYYHDTLASGSGTCFGLPAIYGGTDYAYRNLEKRYNKITPDVLASSARKIPESLGSDWNSINAKVEFFYGKTNDKVNFPHNFWYDTFVRESYAKNIEREIEKSEFERLYSYVLFKIVPYSIRKNIYKNGKWILSLQFSLMSVNEYALYRFILDNMTVTESPQNTYKAVHTLLTHTGSICSDKTFEATTDRRSPPVPAGWQASHPYMSYDHYVCEVSNMKILSKIFDKMKKLGIYDNTKVIIVSDHGDWDSTDLMQAIGVQPFREDFYGHKVNPGLRSALLMVKDYDKRIPLIIDNESLMSNSDVKHIVLGETFDKSKTRVRYYEAASVVPKKDIGYHLQTLYRVDGSMYRPENWSLVFTRDKK